MEKGSIGEDPVRIYIRRCTSILDLSDLNGGATSIL